MRQCRGMWESKLAPAASLSDLIEVSEDFESTRRAVIAAMLFPRNRAWRAVYRLRNEWEGRLATSAAPYTLTKAEVQAFLDAPDRAFLRGTAHLGVKQGSVAGDLLGLLYESHRRGVAPSLRSALSKYRAWAPGKRYGDATPLKYSDSQLRQYFDAASPAAHLWAALRHMQHLGDSGESYGVAFEREGLPYTLGLAAEFQRFAINLMPRRAQKPVFDSAEMLLLPDSIAPVQPEIQLLRSE